MTAGIEAGPSPVMLIIVAITLLITPIMAIKKKHNYKIPVIVIHLVSILLFAITGSLTDKGEIGRDS